MHQILFSVVALAAAVAIVFVVGWVVLELESRKNRRFTNDIELMLRRARDGSSLVAHDKRSLRDAR